MRDVWPPPVDWADRRRPNVKIGYHTDLDSGADGALSSPDEGPFQQLLKEDPICHAFQHKTDSSESQTSFSYCP